MENEEKAGNKHNADDHNGLGMGKRGVTRPMAMHEGHEHHEKGKEDESQENRGCDHGEGGGDHHHHMSDDDRRQMLHMHHKQTLWIPWTVIALGAWMLLAPTSFSYWKDIVQPSGGRTIWLSDNGRGLAMIWSDVLSGIGLMFFGWRMLTPNRPVTWWVACGLGAWLNFAPLIFWAPNAAAYLNGTLVGAYWWCRSASRISCW